MKLNSFFNPSPQNQPNFMIQVSRCIDRGRGGRRRGGLAAQISFLVSVPYKFYQLFDV